MKTCTKCNIEKELGEFYKCKTSKDGLRHDCKQCNSAYNKANSERRNEYDKQWRAKNKEYNSEYKKAYREANKEAISEYLAQWREENKERQKKWRADNREAKAKYQKERKATDPSYRLVCNMRTRVNNALNGANKSDRTMKLVGCTPDQLKEHLESQFTEGMAWGQKGLWHTDHILPCAAFDLTKKKHQKYCFHWSNLQPLWAEANLAKADKYDPEELEKYLKSKLPTYDYAK